MPVMASILVVRALVRFLASWHIFRAQRSALLHRLVCFGMRRRTAWPRSMPRPAAEAAPCSGKVARRREERPRLVVTRVVLDARDRPDDALRQDVHPFARLDQSEPQVGDLDLIVEGGPPRVA